jgi:hypothetical protein
MTWKQTKAKSGFVIAFQTQYTLAAELVRYTTLTGTTINIPYHAIFAKTTKGATSRLMMALWKWQPDSANVHKNCVPLA